MSSPGAEEAQTSDALSTEDWGYLPPPALELVGKSLPPGALLRARLVCKHWAGVLAMVVDQVNIVPEYFQDDATTALVPTSFPRATTVTLDLQDTFTAPPPEAAACATPDDAPAPSSAPATLPNISTDPRPGFLTACTHLRVRLPDATDVSMSNADVPMSWEYVSKLLSTSGQQLTALHLSTAPGQAHLPVISSLTQLTALTVEEASHTVWSADHIPAVGCLTNLKALTIKIPQYRTRPEAAVPQAAPGLLNSWMALTKLTKLHVFVTRYSYHASLVAILPCLTNLESLAIRAQQTRLPWPGMDRPLFDNIGQLTGLTSLSLALVDHTMQAANWLALQPLTGLTALELSVSEGSDGLNIPAGITFKGLKTLKLRYPNSHDLVRIAHWTSLNRLDIKFPEHEREWHQEDACQELIEVVAKLPHTPGGQLIASVLSPSNYATVGHSSWWSPLLPLLALPNLNDFRCSAKEGLASHDPILFDEILAGIAVAWPQVTRLAFKGHIQVQSQARGWDSLKALTRLQQLELRHHPPTEGDDPEQLGRAPRNKFVRVEPIRLPAVSLPDSLQTLLLENVELRRKEVDCLRNLTSLERRTTCRHFPEFMGMPLQRLVVSNCCVKAKGITSIASECGQLTHLVFAVYKVAEPSDLQELQQALREMVRSLRSLQVLKIRVQAACITQELIDDMVTHLPSLQRLKLTSSDGWQDTALFGQLTRITTLRKCSLAYFKQPSLAKEVRAVFRQRLPYCKVKAKHEES